jgi:transcriptional regulator with XRE-family HTH domain
MGHYKTTANGLELLDKWYVDGNARMQAILEEERKNAAIARDIFELRERAGLSQRQLARLADTTASVICKLEDADYEGHSVSMLRRIAAALGCTVEVKFAPVARRRERPTAATSKRPVPAAGRQAVAKTKRPPVKAKKRAS